MGEPVLQGPAPQQASAEMPARKARVEAVAAAASEAHQDDTALLRQKVAMLEQELADSEHTHQLRSVACCFPCTWDLVGLPLSHSLWYVRTCHVNSSDNGKERNTPHVCQMQLTKHMWHHLFYVML